VSAPVRPIRDGEVKSLLSADETLCISIVRRSDGLYLFFEDRLAYDDDEDVHYWSVAGNSLSGLFDSLVEIESWIRRSPEYSGKFQ
jgi:hypothetical protein